MTGKSGWRWGVPAFYVAFTGVLLALPVFRVLHVESCAALALVAFFVSGLDGLSHLETNSFRGLVARHITLLLIPVALFQLARLWSMQCAVVEGIGFLLLFPVITVVLALALARFLHVTGWKRPRVLLAAVGVFLVVVPTVYDVGLHPQFYVYNHVFGGVLGPIYDEELTLRMGLFVFRGLTLLWAGFLLLGANVLERGGTRTRWMLLGVVSAAIMLVYVFPGRTGINTTHGQLSRVLGSSRVTEHFEIFYDAASIPGHQVRVLADEHEFRYAQIVARLGEKTPDRILSYVYPDPDTRGALTGARYTSVAPLWLPRPQLHITEQAVESSLAHELVHVVSEEIGLPPFTAYPSPGLVEGLAVALEPAVGTPAPTDQIAAVLAVMDTTDFYSETTLSEAVASRLGPLGFWIGRGAVSYTTMGSFVAYIIDTYGMEAFKMVYRTGDFDGACGEKLETLSADWEAAMRSRKTSPDLLAHVERRFSRPALTELGCPHHVPRSTRDVRKALRLLEGGDTLGAIIRLERIMSVAPRALEARALWAVLQLQRGKASVVIDSLTQDVGEGTPGDGLFGPILGDALAIAGQPEEARRLYARADSNLSPYQRPERAILALRSLLADDPEIIKTLRSGLSEEQQQLRLAAPTTPEAIIVGALLAHSSGRYMEAYRALEGVEDRALPEPLSRRILWWRANSALLGRAYDAAHIHGLEALYAASEDDDVTETARLSDFLVRVSWFRGRENANL